MVYLICYIISVLFAYAARTCKSRIAFVMLSIVSISVTALLAGLRDITVGIDTVNYLEHPLYWAGAEQCDGIISFLHHTVASTRTSVPEVVFAFLIGLVQQTTGSYHVFLCVVHFIIIGCIYIGAFRLRDHADPELVLFMFYLLYFGQTLNIFRQYMAMAVLFAAFADIEKGRHGRYIIITVIAFFIHNTAVLGLLPLLLYRIMYSKNGLGKVSDYKKIAICSILVIGVRSVLPMLHLLINMGIIKSNFLWYLNVEAAESHALVFLFLLLEAVGILLFRKHYKQLNHYEFFLFCSVSFVCLTVVGSWIKYGDRLAEYFSLINLITIGMIAKCQDLTERRLLLKGTTIGVVLFYWVYVYVIKNASETMPYILGIM